MSLWEIFQNASLVNKALLLGLIALSIWSWAIVIERYRFFNTARRADVRFFRTLTGSWNAEKLKRQAHLAPRAPAGIVYLTAAEEVRRIGAGNAETWSEVLEIVRDRMRSEGEKGLPILAIVASASPFIGLLGTVWGVMIAFLQLGSLQGQPALEVVGPGIAEALIATATGLFAAIPATIAYNAYTAQLRALMRRIGEFNRRLVASMSAGGPWK